MYTFVFVCVLCCYCITTIKYHYYYWFLEPFYNGADDDFTVMRTRMRIISICRRCKDIQQKKHPPCLYIARVCTYVCMGVHVCRYVQGSFSLGTQMSSLIYGNSFKPSFLLSLLLVLQ